MTSSRSQFELYASVISTSPSNFLNNLEELERLGLDGIHFDVMDGLFVPRLGLFPEFLKDIRSKTDLPIEVHMMMDNPEPYIEDFVSAGATSIIPHIESLKHAHRVLSKIKESGAKAGVALNPSTQLGAVEEIVNQVDTVVLMAINPGVVGHAFIDGTFNKLMRLDKLLSGLHVNPTIEIDGGVTFANASKIIGSGNERRIRLICGAGTIFHGEGDISQNLAKLNETISG